MRVRERKRQLLPGEKWKVNSKTNGSSIAVQIPPDHRPLDLPGVRGDPSPGFLTVGTGASSGTTVPQL